MGITRHHSRDCITKNNYKEYETSSKKINYPNCEPITGQPRSLNPPWTVRGLEQNRWEMLPLDPQKNIFRPFKF